MDPKDEIKAKIDLVDLISEYIPLKQAGSVSWKGLCPFHAEKSPSFHVSRDRQIWHCFGCGEGGDCFAFVMKIEGLDFPEALRQLGIKAGIEVARFSSTESNEKQRLIAANTFAASCYRKILLEATFAANARAYLAKRGISDTLAEAFGLGLAPDAWDTLALEFAKRGLSETDGERAGLLMRRKQGSGFIDRFRNRIMIPLRDAQGNTVGFTGRIFTAPPIVQASNPPSSHDVGPKYMNSPETPVYHKGGILFGLDLAKKSIREKGTVIIVEGNLDVIASHKAGIENIVASSGTALTEIQLQLLKRYTTTIIFSFDADAAGFKAAGRGITLARQAGFDVRVAELPASAGKDPDEAVQKDPNLWRAAVEKTVPIMQYFIDRSVAGKDLNNVDDKRKISYFLLPEFAHISDVVEREHWLQIVADLLRTDLGVLRQAAKTGGAQERKMQGAQEGTRTARISANLASARPSSAPSQSPDASRQMPVPKPTREQQALEVLVGIFINQETFRPLIFTQLPPKDLPQDTLICALYTRAVSLYDQPRSSPSAQSDLFTRLHADLQNLADPERAFLSALLDTVTLEAERLAVDQSPQALQGHVRQLIEAITSSEVRRIRKELETDLRRAERAGNKEEVQRLLELYRHLS